MTPIDWIVMVLTIIGIPAFGLWKGRSSKTVNEYLLAGKTMPWYAMGLSIMATQASAITFIATTGQAYVDGMRFVQFYFGLPIAMVILSATAVPIFHKSGVYTAYEYLEKRFDAKTRALAAVVFLIQRGMAVGLSIYAPAIVMSVIFGWEDRITTLIIGIVCVFYTTKGGIPAVTWTAPVPQVRVSVEAATSAAAAATSAEVAVTSEAAAGAGMLDLLISKRANWLVWLNHEIRGQPVPRAVA